MTFFFLAEINVLFGCWRWWLAMLNTPIHNDASLGASFAWKCQRGPTLRWPTLASFKYKIIFFFLFLFLSACLPACQPTCLSFLLSFLLSFFSFFFLWTSSKRFSLSRSRSDTPVSNYRAVNIHLLFLSYFLELCVLFPNGDESNTKETTDNLPQ